MQKMKTNCEFRKELVVRLAQINYEIKKLIGIAPLKRNSVY